MRATLPGPHGATRQARPGHIDGRPGSDDAHETLRTGPDVPILHVRLPSSLKDTARAAALSLLAATLLPVLPAGPAVADGDVVVPRTAAAQPGEQTVVATVTQVLREREVRAPEETVTLLRTPQGSTEVAGDVLADVPSGSTLEVTVAPAAGGTVRVLAAEHTDAVPVAPAEPAGPTVAPTTGSATASATPTVTVTPSDPTRHDVYVVLQAPLGSTPDADTATVRTAVQRAADFWTEQTGGAATLNIAQVVDWNTDADVDCSDFVDVWNAAEARSAFRPAPSTHLLVYTPRSSSCAYGVGTVGSGLHSGGVASVRDLDQSLVAHELGHNLSLGHAGDLSCASASDATWTGRWPTGCDADDYGDYADVMGASGDPVGLGSLNVLHLDRLGLLAGTPVVNGSSASRTVVLSALSAGAGPGRALRVNDPHVARTGWSTARAPAGTGPAASPVSPPAYACCAAPRRGTRPPSCSTPPRPAGASSTASCPWAAPSAAPRAGRPSPSRPSRPPRPR